ncbi:MAG: hypothetical protein IKR61_04715 [Lachnospiraceae bacterium]|nr:hypothetical protein [Lachnospiraceae bacterium]
MSEWIISAEDIDDIIGGRFTVGQKLVRCKDCKWLGIGAEGDGTKLILCIKKHHDTTEDDYCSEGVNREDDPSD